MNKKGQAAMEFLMTYGWAILAAIIAIGVLAYLGVFNPGQYTSGSAVVTAPFYANAWNIKPNIVTLELTNNGGETFVIQNASVSGCGSNSTGNISVANGANIALVIPCSVNLTLDSNFNGNIAISYRKSGSSVDLTSTGSISERVTS